MTTRISARPARSVALALGVALAFALAPSTAAAAPKFYFHVGEVKAGPEIDAATKTFTGEALQTDLASRPEWASDVEAPTPEALAAELQKRKLRGFNVTVRIETLKKEVKEPSPGERRKRVAVDVKLSVFGTTIPEAKLSFSGEGESSTEAEVPDKGLEVEGAAMAKDVIKDAVKQAVDQAVTKLSSAKEATPGGAKRKRKK